MATVKDFRELRVYQGALEAAMLVFTLSRMWPSEERYSLIDQIRRSSRSVCANIAEAWRKRRYRGAFVSKMNDAETEAAETIVWLEFAHRCGYLSQEEFTKLNKSYEYICAQITTMITQSAKWCG